MINILYIADPKSIHDMKWISWFMDNDEYKAFIVCRESHFQKSFEEIDGFLGSIPDYSVFKLWKNGSIKKKLNSWIVENEIDLVHIFYAEPNLLQASIIDVPIVLTSRGSDVLVGLSSFIETGSARTKKLISAYQKAFSKCQAIISTSFRQKDFIEKNFKLDQQVQVIRTGLDISKLIQSEKQNLIFFPRNMQPLYDHELALEAIELLPEDVLNTYEFLFINKNSPNKDYVQKIEQLMNVSKGKIKFIDSLEGDNFYKTISESALVVMTPQSDGAPVSGMEALASGTKLILPKLGYDQDLYNGSFFYKPSDSTSLKDTIVLALSEATPSLDSNYLKKVDRNQEMMKVADIYRSIVNQ